MTPASRLTPNIVYERQEAFRQGHTTSHWPEDCRVAGRINRTPGYQPPRLSPSQRALIPLYDDVDEESSPSEQNNDKKEKEKGDEQPPGKKPNAGGSNRNKRINPK
jgi:hypothetical protein